MEKEPSGSGAAGWAFLLAIPAMLLCCVGPAIIAALGAGTLAALWARGYGYAAIAVLLVAGGGIALWRKRRGGGSACCVPDQERRLAEGRERP